MPLKIAVYAIAKNEEKNISSWLENTKNADFRLVCDTGSTDKTLEILKENNIETCQITVSPWRFDIARNTALNLLPSDIDVCIWQDFDETFNPNWREELEKNWVGGTTTVYHKYRNNNSSWQWHSKIHARHYCIWAGCVHETLKWSCPEKDIWIAEIYLDEKQDLEKDRSGYLKLLEKKISEGDNHWRTFYFLSSEYQKIENWNQDIAYKIKSFQFCQDGGVSKSYIARNIAISYQQLKNWSEAEKWLKTGLDESEERETLFALAYLYYAQKKWGECYIYSKKCLEKKERRDGFTFDARAWGESPFDLAALSAYNLEMYSEACSLGKKALELKPNDPRLLLNLRMYENKNGQSR
jgi:glycosyltransferase involved in cell wall biosynthesis